MNRYTRGTLVLCVLLVVSTFTVPLGAAGKRASKPKPKHDLASGAGYDSWAHSYLGTGEGLRLKRTKFEKHYEGADYTIRQCPGFSAIPEQVSDNTTTDFCYYHDDDDHGYDTAFFFYYDILVPNGGGGWMPSGFWVDGATKVPMIGDRKLDCTIKRSGSTERAADAPFRCETSWTGSGNDSSPHWKIVANPVIVIDASDSGHVDEAAQLIGDNCQSFNTARCNWTRTQKSSVIVPDQKDWISLTSWADSCPPATKEFVLGFSNTKVVGWSDTFGGKVSGKVKADAFITSLEVTLEADYHHTINGSDSYTESYTYNIPLGWQSGLYLQHGLLEVTGDFSIISGSNRYLVKNATFRLPLTQDVVVAGQRFRRGKVQHVDLRCGETRPGPGDPPPPGATIGPATKIE